MEDEFYSDDDLLAFKRVGEFLCWFSMLETNIDECIISLLGLEPLAGRLLLTYVLFARKCDFLGELVRLEDIGFADAEKKQAISKLGEIQDKVRIRNILAHSFFSGQQGKVKFMKAKKGMRADTRETIDDEAFRRHRTAMADLSGWVASITHQIKKRLNKKEIAKAMNERLAGEISRSKLN